MRNYTITSTNSTASNWSTWTALNVDSWFNIKDTTPKKYDPLKDSQYAKNFPTEESENADSIGYREFD